MPEVVEIIAPAAARVVEIVAPSKVVEIRVPGPKGDVGKDSGIAKITDFAAAADGVTNDNAAITAAEASSYTAINLEGRTVLTTLAASVFTKRYFNGVLLGNNVLSQQMRIERRGPVQDIEVENTGFKSMLFDLRGKRILWLGTSIPHQAAGTDGYPEIVAAKLGATVLNNAWSGSHVTWDSAEPSNNIITVSALAMTEDDRLAMIAALGAGTAYSDGFDAITLASQQTADFRIGAPFAAAAYDLVVLDHNHNDRSDAPGTLSPPSVAISSISLGASTVITLASAGTFAVGDAFAAAITGIPRLAFIAARVQAVSGTNVTLNIDSTGFSGAFASGTAYRLSRATIFGGFEFVIYRIKMAAAINGRAQPVIVLSSAPSAYTGNAYDARIWSSSRYIADVAAKWGLPFFDMAKSLAMTALAHLNYFPDTVHPTTKPSREVAAAHWINWLQGGLAWPVGVNEYLPRSTAAEFTDQQAAVYSKFTGAFETAPVKVGSAVTVVTADFSTGYAGWASGGTGAAPTTGSAPWGTGSALIATSNGTQTSFITTSGLTTDKAIDLVFDFYLAALPTTVGTVYTISIAEIRSTGAYYALQLIVRTTGVTWRLVYFKTPSVTLVTVKTASVSLAAATRYTVQIGFYRAAAGYPGKAFLIVNGERVTLADDIDDVGQGNVAALRLGVSFINTGAPFTAYYGNVTMGRRPVYPVPTGTFTTADGKTVTVERGEVVAIT